MIKSKKIIIAVLVIAFIFVGVLQPAIAQVDNTDSAQAKLSQFAQILDLIRQQLSSLIAIYGTVGGEILVPPVGVSNDEIDGNSGGVVPIRETDIPSAPFELTAKVIQTSPFNVRLEWQDNASNELRFEVERSTDGILFFQIGLEASSPGVGQKIVFDDGTAKNGVDYWYRVRASNNSGNSPYSGVVPLISSLVRPLDPPTNLSARLSSSTPYLITLLWKDNSSNEDGFIIEMATSSSGVLNFSRRGSIGPNATNTATFKDSKIIPGLTYYYRVVAFKNNVFSSYSNIAGVTVPKNPTAPNPPSNLRVSGTSTPPLATLVWQDNANDETGFILEKATSTGGVLNFYRFATMGPSATNTITYKDFNVFSGLIYYYRLAAFNNFGTSTYSNIGSATIPGSKGVPKAPSNLSATASSSIQVDLSWLDKSNNETGFLLERSLNGSSFGNIATTTANVIFTSDILVNANTNYWYRLRAYNSKGYSPYSNTFKILTPSWDFPPNAPSNLTGTSSPNRVALKWKDNSANEFAFEIERAINSTSTFKHLATTTANAIYHLDATVSPGGLYYYRIRAWNQNGYSKFSNVLEIRTPIGQSGPPPGRSESPIVSTSFEFTRTLRRGSFGEDVRQLQKFLNSDNDTRLAITGPGSPGNETTYFGSVTEDGVKELQAKYNIVSFGTPFTTGWGLFGPRTRKLLNGPNLQSRQNIPIPKLNISQTVDIDPNFEFEIRGWDANDNPNYAITSTNLYLVDSFNQKLKFDYTLWKDFTFFLGEGVETVLWDQNNFLPGNYTFVYQISTGAKTVERRFPFLAVRSSNLNDPSHPEIGCSCEKTTIKGEGQTLDPNLKNLGLFRCPTAPEGGSSVALGQGNLQTNKPYTGRNGLWHCFEAHTSIVNPSKQGPADPRKCPEHQYIKKTEVITFHDTSGIVKRCIGVNIEDPRKTAMIPVDDKGRPTIPGWKVFCAEGSDDKDPITYTSDGYDRPRNVTIIDPNDRTKIIAIVPVKEHKENLIHWRDTPMTVFAYRRTSGFSIKSVDSKRKFLTEIKGDPNTCQCRFNVDMKFDLNKSGEMNTKTKINKLTPVPSQSKSCEFKVS